MAKNYTLEDVETLRSKAGVSYEEAVALLDKYDGDVARALIELEKRGQLGANTAQSSKFSFEEAVTWVHNLWEKSLKTRICVERKGEVLINLSVLFLVLMLILGPYAMVAAAVLTLLSGCSVSMKREDGKEKNIIGEEQTETETASGEEASAETEASNEAEKDDDDFPSITIS